MMINTEMVLEGKLKSE